MFQPKESESRYGVKVENDSSNQQTKNNQKRKGVKIEFRQTTKNIAKIDKKQFKSEAQQFRYGVKIENIGVNKLKQQSTHIMAKKDEKIKQKIAEQKQEQENHSITFIEPLNKNNLNYKLDVHYNTTYKNMSSSKSLVNLTNQNTNKVITNGINVENLTNLKKQNEDITTSIGSTIKSEHQTQNKHNYELNIINVENVKGKYTGNLKSINSKLQKQDKNTGITR